MICKVCGRTINNEEANFCEYCGTSFREGNNKVAEDTVNNNYNGYQSAGSNTASESYGTWSAQNNTSRYQNNTVGNSKSQSSIITDMLAGKDKPMTFGNWILIYLLPFIPLVGTLMFLVLLFSWGFGANVAPTKKNWARATMVMVLVLILLFSFFLSSGMLGDYSAMLGSLYGQ